eukprot:895437-Pyramimonas_sp.AAC.1
MEACVFQGVAPLETPGRTSWDRDIFGTSAGFLFWEVTAVASGWRVTWRLVIDETAVSKPGATWYSRRDRRLARRAPSPQEAWDNRASSKRPV